MLLQQKYKIQNKTPAEYIFSNFITPNTVTELRKGVIAEKEEAIKVAVTPKKKQKASDKTYGKNIKSVINLKKEKVVSKKQRTEKQLKNQLPVIFEDQKEGHLNENVLRDKENVVKLI